MSNSNGSSSRGTKRARGDGDERLAARPPAKFSRVRDADLSAAAHQARDLEAMRAEFRAKLLTKSRPLLESAAAAFRAACDEQKLGMPDGRCRNVAVLADYGRKATRKVWEMMSLYDWAMDQQSPTAPLRALRDSLTNNAFMARKRARARRRAVGKREVRDETMEHALVTVQHVRTGAIVALRLRGGLLVHYELQEREDDDDENDAAVADRVLKKHYDGGGVGAGQAVVYARGALFPVRPLELARRAVSVVPFAVVLGRDGWELDEATAYLDRQRLAGSADKVARPAAADPLVLGAVLSRRMQDLGRHLGVCSIRHAVIVSTARARARLLARLRRVLGKQLRMPKAIWQLCIAPYLLETPADELPAPDAGVVAMVDEEDEVEVEDEEIDIVG